MDDDAKNVGIRTGARCRPAVRLQRRRENAAWDVKPGPCCEGRRRRIRFLTSPGVTQ